MLRIAICERDKDEGLRWRALIDRYAEASNIQNVESHVVASIDDLDRFVRQVRPNLLSLIVCHTDADSDSERESVGNALREISRITPETRLVLSSPSPDNAICAYSIGAQFLPLPVDRDGFLRTVGGTIRELATDGKRPFPVKVNKGAVNMNLNDITFAETNKKGPIIHLPNSRTVPTKGTLQALYDQLSSLDDRFIRAGGSFIINLDNVRTIGESSVVFGDGETIILPVRARKPVRDAYTAYLKQA